jgi:hypothetical protein
MNAKSTLRAALWIPIGGLLATIPLGFASSSFSACGESGACTQLRETEFANLLTWEACDPSLYQTDCDAWQAQCMIVGGNAKDCTGTLSCAQIAINGQYRTEAEHAVLVSAQQSQGCYLCGIPSCTSGQHAYCEPRSRRCQVYENEVLCAVPDSGSPEDSGSGPESGLEASALVDSGSDAPFDAGFDAGPVLVPDASGD